MVAAHWCMARIMDATTLALFLSATLAGAIATGLAGFAFGLVVAGVWLHILSPAQTAALIVCLGLPVQAYWIWKLRHALVWRRIAPFIIGGTIGVPIGTKLLFYVTPSDVRLSVGILLVLYSCYSLARPPQLKPVRAGYAADLAVGFANGILGGMTGLAGLFITIWCSMRGWNKDEQRAVFQPVLIAAFMMTAVTLAIGGAFMLETGKLFLIGLPALVAGAWFGQTLYGRLDEAGFRRIVLVLLLLSGLILLTGEALALKG